MQILKVKKGEVFAFDAQIYNNGSVDDTRYDFVLLNIGDNDISVLGEQNGVAVRFTIPDTSTLSVGSHKSNITLGKGNRQESFSFSSFIVYE